MYRAFLDMCTGALSGDLLTVYAPDDITLGRLENDRVKERVVRRGGEGLRGQHPADVRWGEPPKASPQKRICRTC